MNISQGIMFGLCGFGVVFVICILGSAIGGVIEDRIDSPVISWEMAELVVWVVAIPSGIFMAILGASTGSWKQGLLMGLFTHGVCFGVMIWTEPNPFAVNCWIHAVLTSVAAGAGALGGWMRGVTDQRHADEKN